MTRRIESYFLYFKDIILEERFKLYVDLHEKILHKDKEWHFFTEGPYDELRFSSNFKNRVDKFLKEDSRVIKINSKKNGWKDSQGTVEEYKWYFTEIFHQNSLMALELYKKRDIISNSDLEHIMDRVVHSFFNMISLFSTDVTLEIAVMKNYLIDRAFYMGMMYQYGIAKEKENDRSK